MEIYTPTHVVLAFEQAMKELEQEGGIQARHAQEMYTYIKECGYAIYPGKLTAPTHVVLAFEQAMKELEQEGGIQARHAQEMYTYIKECGYAIYPGKLTEIMKSYMEQA